MMCMKLVCVLSLLHCSGHELILTSVSSSTVETLTSTVLSQLKCYVKYCFSMTKQELIGSVNSYSQVKVGLRNSNVKIVNIS